MFRFAEAELWTIHAVSRFKKIDTGGVMDWLFLAVFGILLSDSPKR
jgi:hypothetical protein